MEGSVEDASAAPAVSHLGRGAYHTQQVVEVARRLDTDVADGLSEDGAARRLARVGPNLIAAAPPRSWLSIVVAQFRTLVVLLLIAAALVAFVLGELVEGIAILVVIVINTVLGFVTEWKGTRALTALRSQSVPQAHVVRSAEKHRVPASELVPGDVVLLEAGEQVPADGRIVESVRLRIEEASLTGESSPVDKQEAALQDAAAALADRCNMAFLGTVVTDGRGRMVVTATGMATEVGRIGLMLDQTDTRDTPLERRLEALGRTLILVVILIAAIVVVAGWMRGVDDFGHMLAIGIVLAIAAIPEGLPAVATMTLAVGMQRMARRRALIRRLPAVETLGSTTVICTDKTGTLTRGEMTLVALHVGGREIEVTGVGYAPRGEFRALGHPISVAHDEALMWALRIGATCNDAHVDREGERSIVIGDPTEAALRVAAEKAGLDLDELEHVYARVAEVPFDSESRMMLTLHAVGDERLIFVKGAPASVIARCRRHLGRRGISPMGEEDRAQWLDWNRRLASRALRVLALAYREHGSSETHLEARDLVFVGLVGIMDPIRPEAREAVVRCREAGIRTIMITGDQVETAEEIGRQLGLMRGLHGERLRTVHARELAEPDVSDGAAMTRDVAVFARASPEQKLQIVQALQASGEIVAMTGDGINDAPALEQADVGIAMGRAGTEVAKQAADMVILDDSFATIVHAVEEGRVIYSNILRFARYLFACNTSTILTIFVAVLVGFSPPLGVLQILWINLVVDVLAATSLALEPSAPEMMKRPPRDPREPVLSRDTLQAIVGHGILLAGTALGVLFALEWGGLRSWLAVDLQTQVFTTLVLAQVLHVFEARFRHRTIFGPWILENTWVWVAVALCVILQVGAVHAPFLNRILHTVPLRFGGWALAIGAALLPILVLELLRLPRAHGRAPSTSAHAR
jgi:P-type Ca2+ transporter type 2C